ncbi:MAG: hypothetical protein H0X30_22935 [Anaerolineae bacterium]|nr:hypothetical protein [Anaerolineae bacterium]
MSSLVNATSKRNAPAKQSTRRKITITKKRWLLSAHLLFMGIWLGSSICSIALNLIGLKTTDPHLLNGIYVIADILDNFVIRSGAAGSLITGILLAWLAQWGFFRFYWVIAKEIITLFIIVGDQIIIRWNNTAISLTGTSIAAPPSAVYTNIRTLLFIGIILRLVLLLGVIVISVFKPWGQRKQANQGQDNRQEVIITDI